MGIGELLSSLREAAGAGCILALAAWPRFVTPYFCSIAFVLLGLIALPCVLLGETLLVNFTLL